MAQWRKILTDVVQDTTPQLGGNLDVNGKTITGDEFKTSSDTDVTYGAITTTQNGSIVRGGFMNPASEANMVHLPHIVNDLAGFQNWGTISVSGLYKTRSGTSGSYTYSNPVTTSDFDNGAAFDGYSSTAGSWYSDNGVDGTTITPGVITLEWTNELTYSAWAGIVFGANGFTATEVKIEAYRGGAWQTLCDLTGNTDQVVMRQIGSNSGTGSATTKLRYTLGGSVNNSYFRIHTLYAANYRAGDNNLSGTFTDKTRGVHYLEKYKNNYAHGHFYPADTNTYNLGSTSLQWNTIYSNGGNSSQWNTAYGWGNHASAGYLTSETSHADVVVDGDFTSQGIMLRGASSGSYSILTDNSSNWNTAYGWGDHASAGYLTSLPSSTGTLTTFTNAVTIESNSDGILNLKQTGLGGTSGVKDGGWNYIQFLDSEGDRQGYFGIDNNGHFLFNPEVSGAEVKMNRPLRVLNNIIGTGTLTLTGTISASGYNNSNWDTAYGWGNHASAGYLTGITGQSIKNLSDVYSSMAPTDGQVLTYDTTNGWQAETPAGGGGSANMENTFSAPASTGGFQNGARLAIDSYGTNPSATAGTIVSFGVSNVAAVGAQSAAASATGMILVVTDAGDADELLIEGVVKMSSNTGWSTAKKGSKLYMSTTAGAVTTTAPSTAGEFVRLMGYVIDGANSTIYFNPSNDWIEL